jgi:hypothetical protein
LLLSLTLAGRYWLQPKLGTLHKLKYAVNVSEQVRESAAASFRIWHGVAQVINLAMLIGLGIYLWRVANSEDSARFVSNSKFRS